MNKKDYIIRLEKESEKKEVESLVRDCFWNVYRPGCLEHYLLHVIRNDENFVKELDFVMEIDSKIIGQNIFYKTFLQLDNGDKLPILTMGPICIKKEFQRLGYGKALLDYSLEKAKELGFGGVFFEGNIDFYKNSGFTFASNFNVRYHGLSEDDDSSFFLGKELIDGYFNNIKGEYMTPDVYLVNEKEAEIFDREFPYKEKLVLDTQLF